MSRAPDFVTRGLKPSLLELIDYYQNKAVKSKGSAYVIDNATVEYLYKLKKIYYSDKTK